MATPAASIVIFIVSMVSFIKFKLLKEWISVFILGIDKLNK